ncbi:MAG TPA: type II secretion system protein E, partial [Arthrobacter sp.]
MAKRAMDQRLASEFPRHRADSRFADRSLPVVALITGENDGAGTDLELAGPVLSGFTPAAEISRHELPDNYFQPNPNTSVWL